MLGDGIDINVLKYGVICILSVLALIVVSLFKFISGSYFIGMIIFVALVWFVIFKVGITIMYPGSSNYYKSDIEIRIGSQFAKNLHHLGHCFQFVAQCIIEKRVQFTSAQWNLRQKVLGNIHSSIEMLSMFENNLSPRKTRMLEIFRQLLQTIQARHSASSLPLSEDSLESLKSISEFLQHPKKIIKTESPQHKFLCQRIKEIVQLSGNLQQIIHSYIPPQKPLDFIKYKFMDEKLYEVRFGYQRWNHLFEYEVHLINNHGYVLECAVIRKCKNYQMMGIYNENNQPPVLNGKYIMFCNPNGVYIQFFAVQNTYIREYLKQGYQVILWNYRGYGQSTGSPTITKSQSDAVKVYNYFTEKGKIIELVHGYSIGGCAAIGLISKLEKKQKERNKPGHHVNPALRAQSLPNNIKLLIVDRSFSSIGDMAIEFGSALHRLARVVFTFQNKNLSKQFYELKTEKLMLWDKYDEVIPDTASVRCGVLMGVLGGEQESTCKNCANCMKSDDEHQLNQEREDDEDSSEITKKFIQRFSNSLKVLVKNSCEINKTTDLELNANHQYDPTEEFEMHENYNQKANQNIDMTEQVVCQVLNALQDVDGGGCILPHPISQLRKLIKTNPIIFQARCRSYILGLAYYGSVLPVQVGFQSKSQIQLHTIKKIQQTVKVLTKVADQNVQATKILEPQLTLSIQNIARTLTDVKNFIEAKFMLPEHTKFGKLIALNSGHNGSLPQDQLKMLMKYIGQICAHNQDSNSQQSPGTEQMSSSINYSTAMERSIQQNLANETHQSMDVRTTGTNNNFLE